MTVHHLADYANHAPLAAETSAEAKGRTLYERLLEEAQGHVRETAATPDGPSARRGFLRLVLDNSKAAALALAACIALGAVTSPDVDNGVDVVPIEEVALIA